MERKKYAVFTMDVETFTDTDCIRGAGLQVEEDLLDGFDTYMELLDRYDIRSTMFTVGDLAPKIADRLHQCIQKGHRLALHSFEHVSPMRVPLEQFRDKTREAKERLSRLFDTDIQGFRAPCFSIDKDRLDILRDLGFCYDSSHLGSYAARHVVDLDLSDFQKHRRGILSKNGFYEFELAKERLFGFPMPISGGGYVRMGGWNVMRWLIRHHLRHGDYYVFYIHPFELTHKKIPSLKELNALENLYLSAGVRSYYRKIEYIIQLLTYLGYEFVTFEDLTEIIHQENHT